MDNKKPITFHWMWRRHWQINDSIENLDLNGILKMATELDDANVKSVLLPYGPGGIDFSLVIQEALQKTNQLIMTIALPAYGTSPDYAAKICETLNRFAPGRIGVNLVAGRWGDEGNGPAERIVLEHYMHDPSLIDTLEKRVAISAVWMDKVMDLMKTHQHKTHMAVVGSSDTTIEIANKHCEYIYVDDNLLFRDQFKKIDLNRVKPIVIIDPLIINHPDEEQNVRYDKNAPVRKQHHHVKGTMVDVVRQIRQLSEQFGIHDFMIHTDQEDISKLLELVKDFNNIVIPEQKQVVISELTIENFTKIGNNPNNVKIFSNYLSKEECNNIIELIKGTETSNNRPLQPDSTGKPTLSLLYYDSLDYSERYIPQIKSLVEEEYGVKLKPRNSRFAEWVHNNSPVIPIDDLGHKDSNHLAGWVYLNDDYDGGELSFIHQGVSFKPKAGDLVLFPGNIHYWYHVAPANGSRYIMPLWFDFTT
jgi:alkanesulfonate monooxygenase SsuD/methylene tetrahydromethanopterin reductase-like flavin-dependent oxidoreductase (luciferase family)